MAVTVALTALKIDVTSTGGIQVPFEDVYNAVVAIDPTRMTRTGTGPYVYTIHRSTGAYMELEISSGCKVLFEQDDTINIEGITTSGTYTTLDFVAGCEVEIEEGVTFDLNSDGQIYARSYIYVYGKLTLNGTSSNPITFQNYRSMYFYTSSSQYWRYVELKNCTFSGGYLFYYSSYTMLNTAGIDIDMKYITIKNDNGNKWGTIYLTYGDTPSTTFVLENWTIDAIASLYNYSSTMKLKNCTIKNLENYIAAYGIGNNIGHPYIGSNDNAYTRTSETFQPCFMYEGCTFQDNDEGVYTFLCRYGSKLYLKDCTWIGVTYNNNYACSANYGATVLIDNPTYTNIRANPINPGGGARFFHTRDIDITVVDSSGDPIEKACVSLIQSEGYEWHSGFTNSSGQLLSVFGDPPCLVEKEEAPFGTYINWSDSIAAGRYHTIQVSKEGYRSESVQIEMTSNKSIEVTLYEVHETPTTIINSTLYNSTIY